MHGQLAAPQIRGNQGFLKAGGKFMMSYINFGHFRKRAWPKRQQRSLDWRKDQESEPARSVHRRGMLSCPPQLRAKASREAFSAVTRDANQLQHFGFSARGLR
jgi:hypothetical protein